MFEQHRMRSPSQQHQSRKVYDYLNEQPALSASQFRSRSKAKVTELSPISRQQATQYELIVQFQLRRQKEKNIILQERLRNKESFIKQMKQFQDELTVAFEKCQQQLHYYKAQCQEYESKWNSFVTFNHGNSLNVNLNGSVALEEQKQVETQLAREYLQEIADLKHLVIRLEEEINYYEKKQKMNHQSKYMSSSVKKQFYPSNPKESHSRVLNESSPNKKPKHHYKPIQSDKKQLRSKTLANQFVQEKKQENFTTLTKISDFIHTESRKISSFLSHFLTMCQFFDQSIEKQQSIKHKLKKAWKWLKTTIAEWNYLKKEKLQKVKEYKIGNIVTRLLPLSNLEIPQIQTLLQKILKPTEQQSGKKIK